MAYRSVVLSDFSRGLNLSDQTNAVGPGEAIDCLNVIFSERGALKQRDGYAQFTGSELSNQPDSLGVYYQTSGTKYLIAGNGNRLDVLDTSGASVANSTAPTASPHYFARFGGPTAEVVYIANGTDQVRKLSGTTFSAPGGLSGQTGRFLAITPTSNRLVVARESGTTAGNNPSSVNFSDAGAPETFTSSNYIDLDPGDGEAIMGLVTWGAYTFIFKETKFWIHYGESTNASGVTEFSVRKVKGAGLAASKALCAAPDGVYFMSREGVWKTTGGEPQLVSPLLDPFFGSQPTSIYYKSNTLNHGSIAEAAMCWHEHRVYLSVPTGTSSTNDRMLVHDPRYGWWTLFDIPASALASFRIGNQAELVFAQPTGSNYVNRFSHTYTSDAMTTGGTGGTAITSRWRSGWMDLGSSDIKTLREMELWGSGSLTFSVSRDFEDTFRRIVDTAFQGTTGADTWDPAGVDAWGNGTPADYWEPSTTIRKRLVRKSVQGEWFSFQFSNQDQDMTYTIHRVEPHLRETRVPSTVEA